MAPARVRLYSRPGCHLCDEARTVVAGACGQSDAWDEVNIEEDPVLIARFGEQIPVVTVDDAVVGFWRIDPARVVAALKRRSR